MEIKRGRAKRNEVSVASDRKIPRTRKWQRYAVITGLGDTGFAEERTAVEYNKVAEVYLWNILERAMRS